MTKEELIATLKRLQGSRDKEVAHIEADSALLSYLNDPEITSEYDKIKKWYA